MKLVDKKMNKITIMLYICAILMAVCTIFSIYKANIYIASLISQGFDPTKEMVEVINYYISVVTPFAFYTISLFVLGYIVQKIDYLIKNQDTRIDYNENVDIYVDNEDDEIDDFFNNI